MELPQRHREHGVSDFKEFLDSLPAVNFLLLYPNSAFSVSLW